MNKRLSTAIRVLAMVALALTIGTRPETARAQDQKLVAFAAASVKNALDEIDALYQQKTGHAVAASYAASSVLAKQIEAGAPADLFISADLDWMDYVAQRNLIKPATRSNLLGNKLVLIAGTKDPIKLKIAPNFGLAQALGEHRLAMGDPSNVPAGKYGKAALEKLGVWSAVAAKVAPAESVRAALLLVSRGEAPLGIVYQTDAAVDPGVRIVDAFPADSHPAIIYPVALTASSTNPAAPDYLAFLKSPAARAAFEKQGFVVSE
jgi:molybdate transport system substrate-binding protein